MSTDYSSHREHALLFARRVLAAAIKPIIPMVDRLILVGLVLSVGAQCDALAKEIELPFLDQVTAGDITIAIEIDREQVGIADAFELRIAVELPDAKMVSIDAFGSANQSANALGDFELVAVETLGPVPLFQNDSAQNQDADSRDPADITPDDLRYRKTFIATLETLRLGMAGMPSIDLAINDWEGTSQNARLITLPSLQFVITSVLDAEQPPTEIRPLLEQIDVPVEQPLRSDSVYPVIALGLLVAIAVAAVLFWRRRFNLSKRVRAELKSLKALFESGKLDQAKAEDRVSDLLKRWMGWKLSVPLSSQPTGAAVVALRQRDVPEKLIAEIAEFWTRSDNRKFAPESTSISPSTADPFNFASRVMDHPCWKQPAPGIPTAGLPAAGLPAGERSTPHPSGGQAGAS